ncbi:hypothetical protein T05_5333 [Trichinella murrelli]|uniref:Uncharacterized protein n=1 Tax=Trichinella murrelli TaxID=144512 RepID=A0A0V0UFQ6_9BILA|nr:hypothetical protein T05_5333 [Trichinella murrelli]
MYIGCRTVLVPRDAPIVTTRRVGLADLPLGPRQFVRRRSVIVPLRSLSLVFSSTFSERTSTRTTCLHIGHRSRSEKIEDSIYDLHMVT